MMDDTEKGERPGKLQRARDSERGVGELHADLDSGAIVSVILNSLAHEGRPASSTEPGVSAPGICR